MPRKTRKQKERVQQKRHSALVQHPAVKREFEFSFTALPNKDLSLNQTKQVDKSFYFYQSASTAKDLLKTVILAACIFSLEIMIYFAWFKQAGPGYQLYNLINGQLNKLFS